MGSSKRRFLHLPRAGHFDRADIGMHVVELLDDLPIECMERFGWLLSRLFIKHGFIRSIDFQRLLVLILLHQHLNVQLIQFFALRLHLDGAAAQLLP